MIYDRILFTAAAILNLLAALTIFFRPELMLERMRIADPAATLLVRTLFSSVATWGIAYSLIAFDPVRFRDLAWLGAISKTLFFLVQTAAFREDRLSRAAYVPALIDLLLAILFIEYLWRTPPPTQSR